MRTDTALVTMLVASLAACSPTTEEAAPAETAEAAAAAIAAFGAGENVSPFAIGSLQAASLKDAAFAPVNDNMTLAINETKADVDALLTAAGLATDVLQLTMSAGSWTRTARWHSPTPASTSRSMSGQQ